MKRSPLSYLLTSVAALLLIGCGESAVEEAPASAPAPAATPSDGPVLGSPQPEETSVEKTTESEGDQAASDAPEEETEKEAYTPPFPDRVDLFAAPNRKVQLKNGEHGRAVEILGFSNLDQPQALLLVNGEVSTLAEGDSRWGVKILSIKNPVVVYEQGKQRLQLSLNN